MFRLTMTRTMVTLSSLAMSVLGRMWVCSCRSSKGLGWLSRGWPYTLVCTLLDVPLS